MAIRERFKQLIMLIVVTMLAVSAAVTLPGCDDGGDSALENAGEAVEETGEDISDAAEDAADEIDDEI